MISKKRIYPNYISDSSIKSLEINYEIPLQRIAETIKNTKPKTYNDIVEEYGKLKWKQTNSFGVTLYRHTARKLHITPLKWPYNREIVYERLINFVTSTEPRIESFWKDLYLTPKVQAKFLTGISLGISSWAWAKQKYEDSTSKVMRKQEEVTNDLKKILVKLRDSSYVSSKVDHEVTKALDARYAAVFDEEDAAPSWNLWDEKPLRFDSLIESIIARLEARNEKQVFPSWYPAKINSQSADKVFIVRLLQRLMNQYSIKYTHPLIGEMASVILEETISDDDVRKNLLTLTS